MENKLPIFFKSWWLDAVCVGKWDAAILQNDGTVIAVWPYQIERKMGIKLLRNPILTAYLGPFKIEDKVENKDWVEQLWEMLPNPGLTQWTTTPEFSDDVFFYKKVENKTSRVTHYLDLKKTEEQLWKEMHPTRRNAIRKGLEELTIEESTLNIEQFIAGNTASFEKKNKSFPYSVPFLRKITDAANANNASICFSAKDATGNAIGALWLAFDNQKMYYLLSGIAPDSNRGAMALLTWTAILSAQKMGIEIFDFEGSMDAGIARFFQRFGANKINYNEYNIVNSTVWKLKNKLLN